MIDLSRVRAVLAEIQELVDELDGVVLDEREALVVQQKGKARREAARRSQALNLLASRFELGAALTRVEYFHARGEADPTQPDRLD